MLQEQHPALSLDQAHLAISDSLGAIWLTSSNDGKQVCLIEKPFDSVYVIARFGCRDTTDVAAEGMVAGVPGHWYGTVASDNQATATVGGRASNIAITSGVFRVPAGATSVTMNGRTQHLVEP
jgi:hypothetical protein